MKNCRLLFMILPLIVLTSCSQTKTIFKGNKLYQYVNNQGKPGMNDQVIQYVVDRKFKAPIKERTDQYQISKVAKSNIVVKDSADIDPGKVKLFSGLEDIFYTNEVRSFLNNKRFDSDDFSYYYGKFSLSAMTIPLKYRGGVGNDTINPPTLETGFNINFAPAYRLNWSAYNPSRKFLGSNLTNYSITLGGLLGIGGTDLKTKTNSPGLLSDRKSTIFTYGGMILLGLNSIGVGYSFGFDNVLGTGSDYWVYQGKLWQGVTISVDIIK